MKKLKDAFWKSLITRLTILLEFEPCDAVQSGYFQYLDELRSGEFREVPRKVTAFRQTGRAGAMVSEAAP